MAESECFSVPAGHPIFAGHFPGRPIVPGVMLLEWVLDGVARSRGCAPSALRIREAKFFVPLGPDESAQLQTEAGHGRCGFAITHESTIVARGILEWDGDD